MAIQMQLDAAKERSERNRLGQFSTPPALAVEILQQAMRLLDNETAVRFIDPAIGTGAFYSALLSTFPNERLVRAVGHEIDHHYGEPAKRLWSDTLLDMRLKDFTKDRPSDDTDKPNLVICNPPYVRHHHISSSDKQRLKQRVFDVTGFALSGLAGLYCYFLLLSHPWMAKGGLAAWLIPSEFMDVNYGATVKQYLLEKVTLNHIHRFNPTDVQFGDALVSSCIVWFTKKAPPANHQIRMTYGGSLQRPQMEGMVAAEVLRNERKWTKHPAQITDHESAKHRLADFFEIRRGLATGDNKFFIISADAIERRGLPRNMFRPILPSPRFLPVDEILSDEGGHPILEKRLYLLDCRITESEVQEQFPTLWEYLQEGKDKGVIDRYLCQNRNPWYSQERRPASPFLCTYLGRRKGMKGRPFRFILNHSDATAHNVYLMLYPKTPILQILEDNPKIKKAIWEQLQGIATTQLVRQGRVYGGGLHKIEPRELGRVPVPSLAQFVADQAGMQIAQGQQSFF